MKIAKSLVISLLVMALAISAISLVLGGGMVGLFSRAWGKDSGSIKNPSLAKTDSEKRILGVLAELRQGPWMANVDPLHGRVLRIMAEAVNAKNVVEIGTSDGYSALWLCLGLQNTGGHLITHELDPERVAMARANFKRAGVEQMVTVVTGNAHQTVTRLKEPIDLLFIDADKPGYPDYLHKLLPLVRPGGLILADNMSRPTPSPEFIKAITTNPNLETIFLNMQSTGISLTVKKR